MAMRFPEVRARAAAAEAEARERQVSCSAPGVSADHQLICGGY